MTAGPANNSGNGPSVIAPITPYLKLMRPEEFLLPTPAGVFHIDPTRSVDEAVIERMLEKIEIGRDATVVANQGDRMLS